MAFTDKDQFKHGKNIEAILDQYFTRKGWQIVEMTQREERVLCIGDRWFKKADSTYKIEYKSGIQTFHTGNVFLETISVDTENKPGWVYTSRADWIIYATILNGTLLVFKPDTLREKIEGLKATFREVSTKEQNEGYKTHGVIVPYDFARQYLTIQVLNIAPDEYTP